jgi:hypothetical protein
MNMQSFAQKMCALQFILQFSAIGGRRGYKQVAHATTALLQQNKHYLTYRADIIFTAMVLSVTIL